MANSQIPEFTCVGRERPSWTQLAVLLASGALSSAAGSMVAPVFPEVIDTLKVSPWWAGWLVSIHTLTLALATPLLGLAAGRLGHRRVLVGSLVGYALFGVLGSWSQHFGTMFLCRAMVGFASGGIAAVSIGVLSSLYHGSARTKMMGYVTSALASSTVFFPLLGGWVGSQNWRYAFWLHGTALPVAIAALLFLQVPAALHPLNGDLKNNAALVNLVQRRGVIAIFLALALASALFYVVVVYAPLYLKAAMNAPPLINGTVLATRAIGAAVVSAFGATKLAHWLGARTAIALGFFLMSLSLFTIPLVLTPTLIVVSALPFGIGFGIVMPNLYDRLSTYAPTAQQTVLLGLGTGISSLGQFLSPALFGPAWAMVQEGIFFVAAGCGFSLCLVTALRQQQSPE
ncbi:MFS transporter [Lyngbya confervoides]|uniref:MFS transporter n=1 Tax=Lyngbya confervoides BDU141951 TaxID=1574623 RepID=A0ABD4SZQ3_9CYAN|nr:MFS transporter [Lyngbya confervoides]MCM1981947.1 MFS transporter [Lyngbya confervoides BDU141951]